MRAVVLWMTIAASLCLAAVQPLDQATLKDYLNNGAPFEIILIDVRTPAEITTVIGNAACKPYNLAWPEQLQKEAAKIPKDMPIVVYCRTGARSRQAAAYLSDSGHTRVYDAGGFLAWNGPTVSGADIKPASLLPEPSMRAKPSLTTSSRDAHVSKN